MWEKYKKYLVVIFTVFVIVFLVGSPIKIADSGFDFSYDSGSDWSSSSDWGSSSFDSDFGSSSYHGGSGSSDLSIGEFFVFVIIVIIVIIAISNSSKNSNNNANGLRNSFEINSIPDSEIKDIIPDFDRSKFLEEAYNIYINVQNAWTNFDLDSVRNSLTDEMYNMYTSQLETLKIKNEQNIMEGFNKKRFDIVDIRKTLDCIDLKTKLVVEFKDYIIDSTTKKVLRGTSSRKCIVVYELDFVKYTNGVYIDVCPHCGAKVDLNTSTKCEYCGSILVNDKNTNFVLSKKKVIYQKLV